MQYNLLDQATADDDCSQSSDEARSANIETDEKKASRSRIPRGWKFSLMLNAAGATAILLINIGVTIWASTGETFDPVQTNLTDSSIHTLYKGPCETTKKLNTAIHLLINIFSSVLLAASNYCMQCLSAPTRHDIQRAHSHGRWLDIGVPSFHNILRIPLARSSLWLILMMSSLPLHLLYNSAIFFSLSVVDYDIFMAQDTSPGIDPIFSRTYPEIIHAAETVWHRSWPSKALEDLWTGGRDGTLDFLTSEECIIAYGTNLAEHPPAHHRGRVQNEPRRDPLWGRQ